MGSQDYLKLYSDLGVRISSETSTEAIGFCPIHNDKEKPSFSFNKGTGLYKCFVATCQAFSGGNYDKFYRLMTNQAYEEEIDPKIIEHHHQLLLKSPNMMKWLTEIRGISKETAIKFKLGTDGNRLWIPIMVKGKYLNVRKHSSNKNDKVKTMSYKSGMGAVKLWPDTEIVAGEDILICEGELDCMLANQMGFHAVTATSGAGMWPDDANTLIKDVKDIVFIYDIDNAGRSGVNIVGRKLTKLGKRIKDVRLPITTPANADLTDYVVVHGATKETLQKLIDEAQDWTDREDIDVKPSTNQDEIKGTELGSLSHPSLLGQRVKFKATVMGIDNTPYVAPKQIQLFCKKAGTLKQCTFCPIFQGSGKVVIDVPAYSQDILRSFDVSEEQQRMHYRKVVGVIPGCPHWELSTTESYVLHDARLVPEINYSTTVDTEYIMRQAYVISHNIKANHTYEFEGTPYSNPKDQYFTVLLDKLTPIKNDLDEFKLNDDQIKSLEIFNAKTSIAAKMYDIAHDLSLNVTHIIDREILLIVMDLVYHSPLSFFFQGRLINKGRVDALIIGDTRCGKSESFIGIVNHYKAGEIITGENTSKAGLLGGTQQTGNRWLTTWGKIPMNDRRLLIIDEISGMPVEDIGQLSGVRASGIAEINKIQSEKMLARTRTIWAGNPRSNRPLSAYDTGVQAIQELIGRPEDIARFDIAICLRSGEVSLDRINTNDRPKVEHLYTSELCNRLVMWAWSRKPSQIIFDEEAENLCLKLATEMSQRYSSAVPLVEGAEQRIKLARLAVACAARLFSTEDGVNIIVKKWHVQYVYDLLEEVYSGPGLNYLAYSKVKIAEQNLKDEPEVKSLISIYGNSFVDGLLDHSFIRVSDLEDMLNLEKRDIKPIIATLLKQKAIKHYGSYYVKTPAFITLLRKMQLEVHKEQDKQEVAF